MENILNKSIKSLSQAMKNKDISSEELTRAYIKRIEVKDKEIDAYISINNNAIKNAREVDEKRIRGEQLGLLAGIPMALKDNICTKDMKTTCASKMLEHYTSPFDATVVEKLKNENTILLGKLNMDEFAMGSSTETSYFKTTKNPHNLKKVPGGSSGGAAAAVATNEAVFALGSDTGGSVRQPAGFCGVVGLKPTYGTISRNGLIAFAPSLDQIGILSKSTEDMAYVMNAIMGYDSKDSTSVKIEQNDYVLDLNQNIKGIKIALPKEFFNQNINETVKRKVLDAAKKLEMIGAVIEEVDFPSLNYALPAYHIISSAEASSSLSRFDGIKYGYSTKEHESLFDLYKKSRQEGFGKEVKRRILLGTYVLSAGYHDKYYEKALKVKKVIKNAYDVIFEKYDIVLSPVSPTTAYDFGEKMENTLEMCKSDIYTAPVNLAGLPAMSINCGYDEGNMPIGMHLISKAFDESTLIRVANAFENINSKGGAK